jgi:superoxide oxidase
MVSVPVPAPRPARALVALHWVTFVLVVVVYCCMELRGLAPRGSGLRALMRNAHVQLGTLVFLLTALRLALRFRNPWPAIAPRPAAWIVGSATALHVALYGLLLALPVVGWLMLGAEGRSVPFLGVDWAPFIAPDRALAHRLEELHELLAKVGYALVGLHAAAALAHHYFWRDDTLARMLPRRG